MIQNDFQVASTSSLIKVMEEVNPEHLKNVLLRMVGQPMSCNQFDFLADACEQALVDEGRINLEDLQVARNAGKANLIENGTPSPYAVLCSHGLSHVRQRCYLTAEQYDQQMSRPDSTWRCPVCGDEAQWDDQNYVEKIDSKGCFVHEK